MSGLGFRWWFSPIRAGGAIMVSRNGMTWLVIVLLAISAGCAVAPAMASEPSPEHRVIPNPPEEDPETPAFENGSSLRVSDAVYRIDESGDGEVQSELVRWHGRWGHRGWGWGGWGRRGFGYGGFGYGGWGRRRFGYGGFGYGGWGGGFGYPGWGWGARRWAFAPVYRPYYGGYFRYPAFGYGYANAYPVYGNQFAYGYGMSSPYNYGYSAY
jgi:hypothetical protein